MSDSAPKLEIRRQKPRVSNLQAAIVGIVVIAFACYLVFGGGLPFTSSGSAQGGLHLEHGPAHPLAGANRRGAGRRGHGRRADQGQPQRRHRRDGDRQQRPADPRRRDRRHPLAHLPEGNFYVDLHPGTPESRILHSGATAACRQHVRTRAAGQDPVGARHEPRANLQKLVQGFGAALNTPSSDGTTGAQGLNTP